MFEGMETAVLHALQCNDTGIADYAFPNTEGIKNIGTRFDNADSLKGCSQETAPFYLMITFTKLKLEAQNKLQVMQ